MTSHSYLILAFVWKRGVNLVLLNFNIFLLKIIFFMFSDRFNVLISKIFLKKQKKTLF